MRIRKRLLVITTFLIGSSARLLFADPKMDLDRETPVRASEQIPIADFFRPPLLQQPSLNPSGSHIAAIVTSGDDRHQLLVYELKTQKIETLGIPGDRDINQVDWLNDRRLVFQLTAQKLYGVGLMAAEVGALTQAYPLLQYYSSHLVAVPPQDRLRPIIWNRYDQLDGAAQHDLGLAVVNAEMKRGQIMNLLTSNVEDRQLDYVRTDNERHIIKSYPKPKLGMVIRYLTNIQGQPEFCITADNGSMALHKLVSESWQDCPVDLSHVDIIDCGDEPGQLIVLGPRQEGKPRVVQLMDGATGKLGDVVLQDSAYEFYGDGTSLYRDPAQHSVIGATFERNGPHTVWFTELYRKLQKVLDGFFPGLVVRIIGSDVHQTLFLVATYSDRQPVTYNWVDLEKRSVGLIKRSAPWIDPTRMQPMTAIKFKTRDGLQLDAYLTLPVGASKTNPSPLVVLPHGGPWARDTWGFDGEVQFLASRGYAVLQPNFRGSTGYDWMFADEDRWNFAKMHNDVTDATKALIASGLIDRDRIAIMGGSFGGYLAVSGVVNEPTLYRCAVTIAGVFDWEQQIRDKKYDQYDSFVFSYLMRNLGDPKQQPARFDAISPGRHVDKIQVPVFVSGGKDDWTVEIEQSRNLVSALKKYNVPYETYIVGEEGHGMHRVGHEVELYTRVESFLAKNLAVRVKGSMP